MLLKNAGRCVSFLLFCTGCTLFLSLPQVSTAGDNIAGPVEASLIEVVDGDTLKAQAHVWIDQQVQVQVRLNRVDAPELHRPTCEKEKQLALVAKEQLQKFLEGKQIYLNNVRYGKYAGRIIAEVTTSDGLNASDFLLDQKLAQPYGGARRDSRQTWCRLALGEQP